jgi:hypothetical protein
MVAHADDGLVGLVIVAATARPAATVRCFEVR